MKEVKIPKIPKWIHKMTRSRLEAYGVGLRALLAQETKKRKRRPA